MTQDQKEKQLKKAQAFKDFAKQIFLTQIGRLPLTFQASSEEQLREKTEELNRAIDGMIASSIVVARRFNKSADKAIGLLFKQDETQGS